MSYSHASGPGDFCNHLTHARTFQGVLDTGMGPSVTATERPSVQATDLMASGLLWAEVISGRGQSSSPTLRGQGGWSLYPTAFT